MAHLKVDIVIPNDSADINGQAEYVIRTLSSGKIEFLMSLQSVIKKIWENTAGLQPDSEIEC